MLVSGLVFLGASLAASAPLTVPADQRVRTCLPVHVIRETRALDDQAIDFIARDGTVWRNELPRACPMLGFERAFSYSTSIPQLCNVDIITVVQQSYGVRRGASCGLGKFTNIGRDTPEYRAATRERRNRPR